MRIALLIYSLEGGGAERVISLLASQWAELGHTVKLFSLDDGQKDQYQVSPLVEREFLNIAGASSSIFQGFKRNLQRANIVKKKLVNFYPDIVLSFIDSSNILNILSSFGNKWVSVLSERTVPEKRNIPLRWKLARRVFYPFASGIVTQTKDIQEFYRFCNSSKIRVIENPLKNISIQYENRILETQEKGQILAVGRLEIIKGFDLLISAFKIISEKTNWNLRIVGSGSQERSLMQQIKTLKMENRIELAPRTSDLSNEYKKADLFVLSSRVEGFPNVLAEAMSYGLPVIAFDCPHGPRALVQDGKNGLLARSENIEDLADKIWTAINHSDLRDSLSKNALNIRDRLDLFKISKSWINFFEELIAESQEESKSYTA